MVVVGCGGDGDGNDRGGSGVSDGCDGENGGEGRGNGGVGRGGGSNGGGVERTVVLTVMVTVAVRMVMVVGVMVVVVVAAEMVFIYGKSVEGKASEPSLDSPYENALKSPIQPERSQSHLSHARKRGEGSPKSGWFRPLRELTSMAELEGVRDARTLSSDIDMPKSR